jgi:hypothetical protein
MIDRGRIRQRDLPSAAESLPRELHPVSRRVLLARGIREQAVSPGHGLPSAFIPGTQPI